MRKQMQGLNSLRVDTERFDMAVIRSETYFHKGFLTVPSKNIYSKYIDNLLKVEDYNLNSITSLKLRRPGQIADKYHIIISDDGNVISSAAEWIV